MPSQLLMSPVSEEPLARNDLAGGDADMMVDTTMTSDAMPSHLMEATTAIDSEISLPPAGNVTEGPVFLTQVSGFKTDGKMIAVGSQQMEKAPRKLTER